MIIIEKDKHTKAKAPFWRAHIEYHKWFLEQDFNNENNTFISLGDLFDCAIPTPDEVDSIISLYAKSKFKKIYLLAGNHDYSDSLKVHSILPLRNNPRVELILEPCQKIIEGKKFFFMPHYVHSENFLPMREFYENPPSEFVENDYLCFHIEDETIQFGKNKTGIDLSKWKGKRLGGHIHKIQKNYELGMPVQSRFDEKGQINNLLCISDKEQYIPIPKFLDFYDAMYGEPLPKVEAMFPIWDIHDAPSSSEGRKYYFGNHIRKVFVKNEKKDAVEIKKNQPAKRKTLVEFFQEYIAKRTDLSSSTIDRLKNTISKK